MVLSCSSRGLSLGTLVFHSPQKPTLSISNSFWNAQIHFSEFLRIRKVSVGKQITIFFFILSAKLLKPLLKL